MTLLTADYAVGLAFVWHTVLHKTPSQLALKLLDKELREQVLEWCAQGDDLRTFLRRFVASLPKIEIFTFIESVVS
jgi:hypothetical protein